jgi:hypothetical protein
MFTHGGASLDILKHVKKPLDPGEPFRRQADAAGEAPLQLPPTDAQMVREAADIVRTLGNRVLAHGFAHRQIFGDGSPAERRSEIH